MQKASPHVLLAMCLVLLTSCSPPSSNAGSVQLAASVSQALSASVSRVTVTISASDFRSITVELGSTNGVWGGVVGNIPVGAHRSFLAQAFDASDTLLFQGSASSVTIVEDQTTLVAITLHELNPPPPFFNEASIVDSLVASTTSVHEGESLSLFVTAHDPNPGDTLSYAWSSTAGTFSSSSDTTTTWTAPDTSGIQTLTLTATDPGGLSSSLSLVVNVTPIPMKGSVEISISFNTSPRVASITASPTRLAVGQTTSVSASAADPDGDSLTYAWSSSCSGSWTNASSSSAQFTPDALPNDPTCNNCLLTVTVADARGWQTTGTVALCVSNTSTTQHLGPVILSSSRSSDIVSPGREITFEVLASDPEGTALSFAWDTNIGSAGTPVHGATTSRLIWTAPSCTPPNVTPSLSITVTNAFNLTATQSFDVSGLPVCIPPGWASTGAMSTSREFHTATRLANGKVLVTGGSGWSGTLASAEVYDPATGTWSPTGSMATSRYRHTAALLPNGKVLVMGGYRDENLGTLLATAELYDPATGTWSATGPMSRGRHFHTATLLPGGKVLVTGGYTGSEFTPTAELYDPATGTWSMTGSMATSRYLHAATLLADGRVLVSAGYTSGSTSSSSEVYDPATGTWSLSGSLTRPRAYHTSTLLADGKVLVSGGSVDYYFMATAEVYDPATGSWSPTGSMNWSRIYHTATLLPGGRVLVSGGYTGYESTATAELYDPASGVWSTTYTMGLSRDSHTATLLRNGRVLVTGGTYNGDTALYTP
ncbi:kelch-like protein [Cystobacter fuscus]|uniref:kelch repeat-containing protein n=1 Tax=Cystobacter fuscus TaxID=43 RepID=UPI002B2CC91E|nr:kelch-like protein [Cystobacter fuscus]